MGFKGGDEFGDIAVAFDAAEFLFDFEQAGGAPAQFHGAVTPAFDSASDGPSGVQRRLDGVGCGESLAECFREAELHDRQRFFESLAEAVGGVGVQTIEPSRGVVKLLERGIVIVAVVRDVQAAVEFCMMFRRQMGFDIPLLVDLAALDQSPFAPDLLDRTGQRLRAIQHGEDWPFRVQTAFAKFREQTGADLRVFTPALTQPTAD